MMHLPGSHPATWRMPKSQHENFTSYGQIGLDLMGSPEIAAKEGATVMAMTFNQLWMLTASAESRTLPLPAALVTAIT